MFVLSCVYVCVLGIVVCMCGRKRNGRSHRSLAFFACVAPCHFAWFSASPRHSKLFDLWRWCPAVFVLIAPARNAATLLPWARHSRASKVESTQDGRTDGAYHLYLTARYHLGYHPFGGRCVCGWSAGCWPNFSIGTNSRVSLWLQIFHSRRWDIYLGQKRVPNKSTNLATRSNLHATGARDFGSTAITRATFRHK